MYCKYCGKQISDQANICSNCGKEVNKYTNINKASVAIVISVVLILHCFYGIFADALTITEEGELNSLGFSILILLTGCAIVLYKTRVYLVSIICFGLLSLIYLYRIINLQKLSEEYWEFDLVSFQTLYWAYFIILSVFSIILTIKYLYDCENEKILDWFKNMKHLTSDDMNKVLTGMHNKRNQFILVIGIMACFISILSNFYLLISNDNHGQLPFRDYFIVRKLGVSRVGYFLDISKEVYFILSIIFFSFLGIFLYTIYSNVWNKKTIFQLSRGINIGFCAFISQLCSSILFMLYNYYYREIKLVSIIVITINIVLCFSFYIIRHGYLSKIGSNFITFSMICLCISLAIGVFSLCHVHEELNMRYDGLSLFVIIGILKDGMDMIVTIILLLLLSSMKRNLKALDVSVKEIEENPIVM